MSARRDNNPPEEWADKVTESTDAEKKEKSGEIKTSFTVTDRRHSVSDDEEALEEPVVKQPAYVKALEEELRQKDDTLKNYISQYKDAKAEMNKAISRIDREKEREINFRIADLAKAFLSILDDLEAATGAAKTSGDLSSISTGLDLIAQRINAALENIGISPIEAIGKELDPTVHDAVAVEPVDEPEKDGIIIEELKKGYKLGDVLVRPTAVVVGKFDK